MDLKCKHCGHSVTFDPELQLMVCDYCLSTFPVDDAPEKSHTLYGSDAPKKSADDDMMDYKIYHCNDCGAELVINDVELATYCAYCGQPSIVYSRTEKRQKPQYVIPFKISKNEALTSIREKFVKSEYVSADAKYFTPDLIRGIYIPYAMFCYHVHDDALLSGIPSSGKVKDSNEIRSPKNYFRRVFSRIGHIPVDASYHFPNKSADLLEPFHGKDLEKFNPGYLSGYYADLRDENFALLKSRADGRAKKIYEYRLETCLPFVDDVKIKYSNPKLECVKEVYALLPVWFTVVTIDDEKYTIMVNGQTGKVAGALPTSYKRLFIWFFTTFFFSFIILCPLFLLSLTYYMIVPFITLAVTPPLILSGIKNIRKYNLNKKLTTSKSIRRFAKERQKH